MMVEYYADIRWLHIGCVATSGTLFAVRGLATCLGAQWTMAPGLRYLSYVLDTLLLCAGLFLAIASHQYPFVVPWLTAKVLLLPLYVVLGSYALKRARTPRIRATCYITALAVFLLIISVARTRNPAGLLAALFS